jgi:hypothetical protein
MNSLAVPLQEPSILVWSWGGGDSFRGPKVVNHRWWLLYTPPTLAQKFQRLTHSTYVCMGLRVTMESKQHELGLVVKQLQPNDLFTGDEYSM